MANKRSRTVFVCNDCGATSAKWMGRCPGCGAWNTLREEEAAATAAKVTQRVVTENQLVAVGKTSFESEERYSTGIGELDRVLGGGVVPGSVLLLGGEPGVGKSTLLLQAAHYFATGNGKVLYVSAEESERQVQIRARRLGVTAAELFVLNETDLEIVLAHVERMQPALVIIDSIQTVSLSAVESAPGNMAQVTACAGAVVQVAKALDIPFILVGHITKAGALAGPKVLEHAVDVVLSFEGERHTAYRLLRAMKNRYGSTNELGVFLMGEKGLAEVPNPSAAFLAERQEDAPGSVVVACMEGTRPVLLELQALVAPAPFGGTPRRQMAGVDRNRAAIVLAVLEKRAGLDLQNCDVYISVAGGLSVDEPAADLGIALAVSSSYKGRPVASGTVVFGEIGLAGELRSVGQAGRRVLEAAAMGFTRCVLPRRMPTGLSGNIQLVGASRLTQALEAVV